MITEKDVYCKTAPITIHWSAIFAGALVGIGLGFLLNIFSLAIGLSAYTSTPNGANVIAIGGFIGLLIGVIVSMGLAGFVSGYLGRFYHCYCHGGIIYGFITWSIALMLSALLIMPLAHYVDFYEENLNPALMSSHESTAPKMSEAGQNTTAADTSTSTSSKNLDTTHAKHLAWSGWILFALFFIGAISSCIGACSGMNCKKDDMDRTDRHLNHRDRDLNRPVNTL